MHVHHRRGELRSIVRVRPRLRGCWPGEPVRPDVPFRLPDCRDQQGRYGGIPSHHCRLVSWIVHGPLRLSGNRRTSLLRARSVHPSLWHGGKRRRASMRTSQRVLLVLGRHVASLPELGVWHPYDFGVRLQRADLYGMRRPFGNERTPDDRDWAHVCLQGRGLSHTGRVGRLLGLRRHRVYLPMMHMRDGAATHKGRDIDEKI